MKQVHDWIQNRRNKKPKGIESPDFKTARRKLLKKAFNSNQRPNKQMLDSLMEITGLSPSKLTSWYKNERYKQKNKAQLEFDKYKKRMVAVMTQVGDQTVG